MELFIRSATGKLSVIENHESPAAPSTLCIERGQAASLTMFPSVTRTYKLTALDADRSIAYYEETAECS